MSRYDHSLFFFDPSNNQTIEFPCKIDYTLLTTVCFFHPPTSPDCTVVGIGTPTWQEHTVYVFTLKRGNGEWEGTEYSTNDKFLLSNATPTLHRGLIYFLDLKGDVARLDMSDGSLAIGYMCLMRHMLVHIIYELYLFKVNGDDEDALFAVLVINDEREVRVFRLLEQEMKWELVEDIGDKVLYLSHTSSFGDKAHTESMANTIYFPPFHGNDVPVFYSLSDRKYHSIDGNYSDDNAYGLKRLSFAAWVMPAPITSELATELTWKSSSASRIIS